MIKLTTYELAEEFEHLHPAPNGIHYTRTLERYVMFLPGVDAALEVYNAQWEAFQQGYLFAFLATSEGGVEPAKGEEAFLHLSVNEKFLFLSKNFFSFTGGFMATKREREQQLKIAFERGAKARKEDPGAKNPYDFPPMLSRRLSQYDAWDEAFRGTETWTSFKSQTTLEI